MPGTTLTNHTEIQKRESPEVSEAVIQLIAKRPHATPDPSPGPYPITYRLPQPQLNRQDASRMLKKLMPARPHITPDPTCNPLSCLQWKSLIKGQTFSSVCILGGHCVLCQQTSNSLSWHIKRLLIHSVGLARRGATWARHLAEAARFWRCCLTLAMILRVVATSGWSLPKVAILMRSASSYSRRASSNLDCFS